MNKTEALLMQCSANLKTLPLFYKTHGIVHWFYGSQSQCTYNLHVGCHINTIYLHQQDGDVRMVYLNAQLKKIIPQIQ